MTIPHHIQSIIFAWDDKTCKRFIEFVKSPFFNKHEVITLLAEGLIKYRKQLLQKDWNETAFWEIVFPKELYVPYKKHRLYSKVLTLIEDFIIVQQSLQDNAHHRKSLIDNYIENQHQKLADTEIKKYALELRKGSTLNNGHLKNVLELEELRLSHSWQFQRRGKLKSDIFNPLIKALDSYYYIYRLELCTYLQYLQNMQYTDTIEQSENFIPKTLALIEKNPYILNSPHAKAYYYIVKMYHESIDFSFEIIDLIKKYESSFKADELTNIFTHLRSFHIFKAQKGNETSLYSITALYETCIDKGWIYNTSGYIMVSIFLNYIQFSIYLNSGNDVINTFINAYKIKIHPNYREDVLLIAQAMQAFVKADYSQVIKKLQLAKVPDVMVNLQVRRLEMKTYFETEEIESLISAINAFRVFIQRCDNLQTHIVQANRNFASELRRLVESKYIDTRANKEAMTRMKDMDFLVEYWWLKEKWEGSKIAYNKR